MAFSRPSIIDANLQLCDGATIKVDDICQVDSADAIVTLGNGPVTGTLWIYISAIEIASNDETYEFQLQGSTSATFADTIENIPGCLRLGAKETVSGTGAAVADVDSTTGVYSVPFSNDIGGTVYPYVRLALLCGGTQATGITIGSAYLTLNK